MRGNNHINTTKETTKRVRCAKVKQKKKTYYQRKKHTT